METLAPSLAEEHARVGYDVIAYDVSAVWGKFLGFILDLPAVCCFPGLAPQWRAYLYSFNSPPPLVSRPLPVFFTSFSLSLSFSPSISLSIFSSNILLPHLYSFILIAENNSQFGHIYQNSIDECINVLSNNQCFVCGQTVNESILNKALYLSLLTK